MIRTLATIAFVVAVNISLGQSAIFEVHNSTISDVTISGNVAEVTRSFVLTNPPEGLNSVLVCDLPNTLDERSIKVTGRGGGQVVSTEMSSKNPNRENDAAFSQLATDLEKLHGKLADQIQELAEERTGISERFQAMKVYIRHFEHSNHHNKTIPSIQLQNEVLNFQEKETKLARVQTSALDAKTRATQETLDTVSAMLDNLHVYGYYKNLFVHPTGPRAYSHADLFEELQSLPLEEKYWPASNVQKNLNIYFFVLPFEETGYDRELTFTLKYMATPAQWQAEYDVRVETVENASTTKKGSVAVRIGLYALVTQSSREDWVAAMLHLSTAQPQQSIHAPPPPAPTTVNYEADAWQRGGPSVQPSAQPSSQPSVQPSFPSASPSAVPTAAPSAIPSSHPESRARQQQERNQQEMSRANVGSSGQGGSISAAVKFHLPYPVTIPSNHLGGVQPGGTKTYAQHWGARRVSVLPPVEPADSKSTRLFIGDMIVTPHVFTYVVPTPGMSSTSSYLRAWNLPNASHAAALDNSTMPLLASNTARVFIEDTYMGITNMPRTQPGAALRLNLGQDRNIEIRSNFVTPRRSSRSEDKSGWFTTDKTTYKVEVSEYAFTVRSTHAEPHLVVLSDYLPKMGHESIKFELLQPVPASIVTLKPPGASEEGVESDEELQEMWTEEDFIAAVLTHPSMNPASTSNVPTSSTTEAKQCSAKDTTCTAGPSAQEKKSTEKEQIEEKDGKTNGMKIFMSKGTRNLVWAQWVLPGETITAGLKYRTIWPEEKEKK
eukprot:CAMPEP_0184973110 /NCGR_PEP_ID=MMETSP1098-20130426/5006_1 /TAXON_ID=89044 /ORGANISM="Spumella elongata, Strain CCAP 955/1" /LENGTH=776 /DNA_ID=CAMNT_0027495535 /DNA_START=48 /DNA_END=2378 /DNA_ORIENTATION=+